MWWNWLTENLAVLSAVMVPVLLGVLKPILERERQGGRGTRKLTRHASILGALPAHSDAAKQMDSLVAAEIASYRERLGRKVDGTTLATIVFVSLVGGAVSFGLVTWAQAVSGPGAVVLWVATAAWILFVLLLVFIGGGSSLYNTPEGRAQRENRREQRKLAKHNRRGQDVAAAPDPRSP